MKVLSLFDGMSCGMLAMLEAGVKVDRYVAYEIDKYAVRTSSHNFPMIEQRGDVFQADFTEFAGFDWLVGGSPCTYWSIAQTKNRETVASGMGWELFSQYVRALHEAKPKYFIYENNKSMSKAIRASIDETFGFEAVLINSALVSAQNRQRLYWVGKRNPDGTYSKADVEQPEDRGILLRDILEDGIIWQEKSYTITTRCCGAIPEDTLKRHRHTMVAEPINCNADGKSFCVTPRYYKCFGNNPGKCLEKHRDSMVAEPLVTTKNGKSFAITANYAHMQDYPNDYAAHTIEKSVKPLVAEPVNITQDGKGQCLRAAYYKDGIRNMVGNTVDRKTCVAEPVECKTIINSTPEIAEKFGYAPEMFNAYNRAEITDKAPTLSTGSMATSSCAVNRFEDVCGYATLCEWDESGNPTKAVSAADGKTCAVYEVKDGQITIKGKQYPIKLKNGYYIIRKLTVRECMRLQTVPEWYEFPVSDSQAYKMLGNGWTVDVIAHILKGLKEA